MNYAQILQQRPFAAGGMQMNPYANMFASLVNNIAGFRQDYGGGGGGGGAMMSAGLPSQDTDQRGSAAELVDANPYMNLGFTGGGNSPFERRHAPVSSLTESYYG